MTTPYQRATKPKDSGLVMSSDVYVPVAATPKQGAKVSLPLLRAIHDAKIDPLSYCFQTCYPHISDLGDPRREESNTKVKDTFHQQSERRRLDSARRRKFEMCGKLTTTRHAYANLLEGEEAPKLAPDGTCRSPRSHLVGRSMKPEVFHELPYGSECPMLIGDKTSVYRSSFASPRKDGHSLVRSDGLNGGAIMSPRSVMMRKADTQIPLPLAPPSPRSSTRSSSKPPPTTFSSMAGNGTSRAQIASDSQAIRELQLLTDSARNRAKRAAELHETTGRF
jgi:hypothetical protein